VILLASCSNRLGFVSERSAPWLLRARAPARLLAHIAIAVDAIVSSHHHPDSLKWRFYDDFMIVCVA
jgi:hypothetical protein